MFTHKTERKTDMYCYQAYTSSEADEAEHMHDYYEITSVCGGNLSYIVEGNEYLLSQGDIIFTVPGMHHRLILSDNSEYSIQLLQFKRSFVTDAFRQALNTVDMRLEAHGGYIPSNISGKYGLNDIFPHMHTYAVSPRSESDFMILTYALQLITKTGEILKYEHHSEELRTKKNIKKIIDYINENLSSPLNLDSIARYLYMDKSYICRLFKSGTGITISTYINMQKTGLAKNMLLQGIKPRAVFAQCGFNDYSTFYRTFKKHTGVSPEEFRRFSPERQSDNATGGSYDLFKRN